MDADRSTAGRLVRTARQQAGLTQRELGRRAGVTQSVISAYESGHRQPTLPTLMALLRASGHRLRFELMPSPTTVPLGGPLGRRIARHRRAIRDVAARHGATNLRVFGSVARGDEAADSDIDVLVDLPAEAGLFALMRLRSELGRLLDANVDLVPAGSLRPEVRAHVESDLVAL